MESLQPRAVWSHFATLCAIPRPSLHEDRLRKRLIDWAQARGIDTCVDAVGNLILRKPASPGCDALPGVILQGHLDMVCQANAGIKHDFERDPIRTVIHDGWLVAEDTTLGADNGIGVALALAALEAPGLTHPALEVLLTINEESGMDGARGLAPGTLQGRTLINLDTEEWGYFYLGCAGGVDVEIRGSLARQTAPAGHVTRRLDVAGLRGGHSGIDIHLGRGNAVKLIAEALQDLARRFDLHLQSLHGGTARNAIPREASAVFTLPRAQAGELNAWAHAQRTSLRGRFGAIDPGLTLNVQEMPTPAGQPLARGERDRLIDYLARTDNGVANYSATFPGVVETSCNLGVVRLDGARFDATFKVRSLDDDQSDALADRLVDLAEASGLHAEKSGAYPGWTPDRTSALLALCQRVYMAQFGQPARLQVIHAGLECGLLAASHPHLDMISFGPDIRGAHAPGERVQIASVERCWALLKGILQALAAASPEK